MSSTGRIGGRRKTTFAHRQREAFVRFRPSTRSREPAEEGARNCHFQPTPRCPPRHALEWWYRTADAGAKGRLRQVVSAIRRLSGGAYARWQDLLDRKRRQGVGRFRRFPGRPDVFPARLVAALGRDLTTHGAVPGLSHLPAAPPPTDTLAIPGCTSYCSKPAARSSQRHSTRPCGTLRAACVLRPDSALFSPSSRRLLLEPTGVRPGGAGLPQNQLRSTPIPPLRIKRWGSNLAKTQDQKGRSRRSRKLLSGSVRISPERSSTTQWAGRSGPP
jgi:hypothetical protein